MLLYKNSFDLPNIPITLSSSQRQYEIINNRKVNGMSASSWYIQFKLADWLENDC